ncbi:MAG: O-methyltransferase [Bacteroidales bacterium]|nr:O-methyltransferase [Bacteroidales bacterium]
MEIDDYILEHIEAEPEHLQRLYRNTYLRHLYPRMCSGHLQGRLLKMLTQMIQPKRIIELGTFTGYSALCFAEGMPDDAVLHTVEIDDEMADELRSTFDSTPWADRIHLHIGDALEVVPTLDEQWDLAFIDANKRNYIEYYEMLVPRMRPGGYIIADNTLWSDKVLDPAANHDPQTRAVLAFNDHIVRDPRVSVVILPLRDGMTLIRIQP